VALKLAAGALPPSRTVRVADREVGVLKKTAATLIAAAVTVGCTYALYTSTAGGSTNASPACAQYGCAAPTVGTARPSR
jgi:hypothetical protein